MMVEVDATDRLSLRYASYEELKEAFLKYDRYYEYGPRLYRADYRKRLNNIIQELRARKSRLPKENKPRG